MIKLIDVTYNTDLDFKKPEQVLERRVLITRYAELLRDKMHIQFVKHAAFEGFSVAFGQVYHFFKGINKFRHLPLKANRFIGKQQPDVVLVQGLGFPLQILSLRMHVGTKCKIIVQHHGELPYAGVKLRFQKLAAAVIDGYFFTSAGNAEIWKQKRVIGKRHKIFEVPDISTDFTAQCKCESRKELNISTGEKLFLWVGNLNANQNPLSILKAFNSYTSVQPNASLYMIYQEADLLGEIEALLAQNPQLKQAVHLKGHMPHQSLPVWFSAADYYLSGDDQEGDGCTLLESMACGCVPMVPHIPLHQKITDDGRYGHLYQAGDDRDLYETLCRLDGPTQIISADIVAHFKANLSFERIAHEIYQACRALVSGEL